jgi:hypothetical protein
MMAKTASICHKANFLNNTCGLMIRLVSILKNETAQPLMKN